MYSSSVLLLITQVCVLLLHGSASGALLANKAIVPRPRTKRHYRSLLTRVFQNCVHRARVRTRITEKKKAFLFSDDDFFHNFDGPRN